MNADGAYCTSEWLKPRDPGKAEAISNSTVLHEVAEACFACTVKGIEEAYQRSDLRSLLIEMVQRSSSCRHPKSNTYGLNGTTGLALSPLALSQSAEPAISSTRNRGGTSALTPTGSVMCRTWAGSVGTRFRS